MEIDGNNPKKNLSPRDLDDNGSVDAYPMPIAETEE